MNRIFRRELGPLQGTIQGLRNRIGVIGISESVGVSFFCCTFASFLVEQTEHKVSVMELGKPAIFDAIGIDKRFAGREYYDYFADYSSRKLISKIQNIDEGINWMVKLPEPKLTWNSGTTEHQSHQVFYEEQLLLIEKAWGDVVLCDFSGMENHIKELLQYMDQVVFFIDPLPSKILKGQLILAKIKELEQAGLSVVYVINQMNRGVRKKQMEDFLQLKGGILIPLIPKEYIYTAEYQCRIPYNLKEVKPFLFDSYLEVKNKLNL